MGLKGGLQSILRGTGQKGAPTLGPTLAAYMPS